MSHQTVQTAFVTITDLNLLEQAVRAVTIESLGTNLVLDRNRKTARYYGSAIDSNPKNVGVITYGRELTPTEKMGNYEIAVRSATKVVDGSEMQVFDLFADTHASDRTMQKKIAQVLEGYQIAIVSDEMTSLGAIGMEEVTEGVPDGYRCVEFEVPA